MKPRIHEPAIKFLFTITVISCLLLTLLIPGCNQESSQAVQPPQQEPEPFLTQVSAASIASTAEPGVTETTDPGCECGGNAPAAGGYALYGMYGNITLDKAPRTNEPANLTWCIRGAETWEELHAWIQFEYDSGKPGDSRVIPASEAESRILKEGVLTYDGSLKEGEEKSFEAVISFPMEGKWKAYILFLGKSVIRDLTKSPGITFNAGEYQYLYITDTYSQLGFPKMYPFCGSLTKPGDIFPVGGYIDIDKPPALNEPVEIRWGAGSTSDIKDINLRLEFMYPEPGGNKRVPVPPEEILINGDTSQSISVLSKNEQFKDAYKSPARNEMVKTRLESIIEQSTVHYAATVKFPEEGDWHVILSVEWTDDSGKIRGGGLYMLCFNISPDGSHWGWKESHMGKPSE